MAEKKPAHISTNPYHGHVATVPKHHTHSIFIPAGMDTVEKETLGPSICINEIKIIWITKLKLRIHGGGIFQNFY